ncbi:SBP-bac-5 domain-containing protein [Sulfidibacter corallicola]|uniref:Solute-binding protein family 5 domain-containing protein n=1 Tax=Sulfidibacter corallicola TaxID=2818388 RepID=A0A8A4TLV0_SULCO|nr:ABC transporter substrate-binding protein [Sulfidibacter corallicola]QTD50959.1 hypothetical protein J3U87_00690 [Sulfidibacter corallicola]
MHRFLMPLVLFGLLILCHCGREPAPTEASTAPDAKVETPDHLRIGMLVRPDSTNPYLTMRRSGMTIVYLLYPKLFKELPNLVDGVPDLQPFLVKQATWDEAGTTVTLLLRDDLTWSDGTPITTADVAYSFEAQRNEAVAWMGFDETRRVADWKVTSPQALQVTFKERSLFNMLSLNEGFIVPKHRFETVPWETWLEHDWTQNPVVYGPYLFDGAPNDEGMRLVARDPEAARIDRLDFAFIRDKEALYQLLLAGELDYSWSLPTPRIADVHAKLHSYFYNDFSMAYLAWNPLDPEAYAAANPKEKAALDTLKAERPHRLFGDARVRRAMTLLMDRNGYNQRLWAGQAGVPLSPWRAGLPYLATKGEPEPHDPKKATELLTAAGWAKRDGVWTLDGEPVRFTVVCNAGSPIRENVLLAVQQDLAKEGIDMQIDLTEPSRYLQMGAERRFDAAFAMLATGSRPDVDGFFNSEAALGGAGNWSSWTAVDDHLQAAAKAADATTLTNAMAALEAAFIEDQPVSLLFAGRGVAAMTPDSDVVPRSCYLSPLFEVDQWRPRAGGSP